MRKLKLAVCILAAVIIQTTLLGFIDIRGIVPDIFLGFVISYAIVENEAVDNLVTALVCAALATVFCGRGIIYSMLFYTYSALAVFSLPVIRHRYYKLPSLIAAVVICCFIKETLYYFLLYRSFDAAMLITALLRVILPSCAYTAAAAVPIYLIVKKLFTRETRMNIII